MASVCLDLKCGKSYHIVLRLTPALHSIIISSHLSILLQRQGINSGVGDMHQSHDIVSGLMNYPEE